MNLPLSNRPRLRSGLAAAMVVLFLQGFLGTFVHFEIVDHYWCAEHQHTTHDEDHVAGQKVADASDATQSKDDQRPDHAPKPDKTPECHWLTWVQKSSISMPPVAAGLLDLPPPAADASPRIPSSQTSEPSPIALRHLSPINSPPRAVRG